MIELSHVTKKYGDHVALHDITCCFEAGTCVGIIGPNGSGKSTLARLLNGLIQPTSGVVTVDNLPVTENTLYEVRKKIGMVFQNPDNQIVASTVIDDIAFGLENQMRSSLQIEKRCEEALAFVDMTGYADHMTATLSGGQKQRVALAGVVAMDTPYIVLDEPTSLLDAEGRTAVVGLLQKIRSQGRTVILISHFMDEVFIADKVLVLHEGTIIFFDTPHALLKNDTILQKIGFSLPLHLQIAKSCSLYPDIFTVHTVMQMYKERYGLH